MAGVLDYLFKRRSIRRFTAEPVADETLVQLLHAAMAAPTACNTQPWEFVVVTDPEGMAALRRSLHFAPYNAPAAIVVCGNPSISNHERMARDYWVQDCSAATENLLIAAAGLDLGAVWIGVYPSQRVIGVVRDLVALPETVTPLCVVYVGHPAEDKPPRTQYDAHRVHWQQYEPRKRRARQKNAKKL
ncbi:MAG TPA: nitroreductase family protein [Aggregatilinea sp.]|jgi:nitroreductase|uniref:nitroreductase family protein n=1 Tax=Aggregatilinea sp. TaxID=2806333 RepID=UPI002D15E970|nr:nitroreductase family protein [Aggregatilinea sp.]HML24765.1 nitroreductase family protein [Aggregatilinea sp.]